MKIVVPKDDGIEYPTLGPQVCDFIEERFVFGPGSLAGQPVVLDRDQKELIWRAYEHVPRGFRVEDIDQSGKRRFDRVSWSVRKGSMKTETMAYIGGVEIHPDAPVRFAGYDPTAPGGLKTGRPVNDPYVPFLAHTKEQVEELGYGALKAILETCDDADLFDCTLTRIIQLNKYGKAAGKCVPLAGSPNSRDGARTTMQGLDETHRLYSENHRAAIETMLNNLPKRSSTEDPWQLSTTTAGEPGQGSYAEDEFEEGMANWEGRKKTANFFFMHRQASDDKKFDTMANRIEAIKEATGPGVAKWTDFVRIAAMWDREGADPQYLERVWGNRWTQTGSHAFDADAFALLGDPSLKIQDGAFCTLGFDGAVFQDSTALVLTEISTGIQNVLGLWERPDDLGNDENGDPIKWRVPEAEVDAAVEDAFSRFQIWRMYGDPPHWVESMARWSAKYPDQVVEFWTKNHTAMFYAVKNYQNGIRGGDIGHDGNEDFVRHIRNTGKRTLTGEDEDGQPKFILCKIKRERKFDAAVAAVLSWEARMDAIEEGAVPEENFVPRRIR